MSVEALENRDPTRSVRKAVSSTRQRVHSPKRDSNVESEENDPYREANVDFTEGDDEGTWNDLFSSEMTEDEKATNDEDEGED